MCVCISWRVCMPNNSNLIVSSRSSHSILFARFVMKSLLDLLRFLSFIVISGVVTLHVRSWLFLLVRCVQWLFQIGSKLNLIFERYHSIKTCNFFDRFVNAVCYNTLSTLSYQPNHKCGNLFEKYTNFISVKYKNMTGDSCMNETRYFFLYPTDPTLNKLKKAVLYITYLFVLVK